MSLQSIAKKHRHPEYPCSPLFYTRWSPRAMTGESIPKEELLALFEAARWAPSSRNNQPWRFVIAIGKNKEQFLHFLGERNQIWCKNAAALVVVCSSTTFEYDGSPSKTHSSDTGAACMSLALEGARRGLVVHAMEGFDYDRASRELKVPTNYKVELMITIGKLAKSSILPEELAKREIPNQRKPLKEIISWEEFICK